MIQLAKDLKKADQLGAELVLTFDEIAVAMLLRSTKVRWGCLGDEILRLIAQELVKAVKANVTIDWSLRENVSGKPSRNHQKDSAQVWQSARHAVEGNGDSLGTSWTTGRRLGKLGNLNNASSQTLHLRMPFLL